MQHITIAVIEDDKTHADLLAHYIKTWMESNPLKCSLHTFSDAESFLFEWEENQSWDALFLDIHMPGIDGMELARKIRSQNEEVILIFTTGITDYMQEGYEVSALHYLVKPIEERKVAECLERIGKETRDREKKNAFLLEVEEVTNGIPGERKTVRFLPLEILYVEAFAHYTEVHIEKGIFRVREGIGVWKERLKEDGFVSCHRSYLVNLRYVARVEKGEIVLDQGERIPLSRRNQKAVNEAFIRYYSRKEE